LSSDINVCAAIKNYAVKLNILERGKVGRDELMSKIRQKQEELSGFITSEGAAIIIGRELGVEFGRKEPEVMYSMGGFGMFQLRFLFRPINRLENRFSAYLERRCMDFP